MANELANQGNLDQAVEMFGKALAIKIRALGPEHVSVGNIYGNMAAVLQMQGIGSALCC